MPSFMVAVMNRDPHGVAVEGPPAYSPEWVAQCYGVNVTDDCPEVSLTGTIAALVTRRGDEVQSEWEARVMAWMDASRHAACRWAGLDPSEDWEGDHGLSLNPLIAAYNAGDEGERDAFMRRFLSGA